MFTTESYNSLVDLIREFPNDEACRKHLEHIRWGGCPSCAHCGSTLVPVVSARLLD